jgi:hypothetical protein
MSLTIANTLSLRPNTSSFRGFGQNLEGDRGALAIRYVLAFGERPSEVSSRAGTRPANNKYE